MRDIQRGLVCCYCSCRRICVYIFRFFLFIVALFVFSFFLFLRIFVCRSICFDWIRDRKSHRHNRHEVLRVKQKNHQSTSEQKITIPTTITTERKKDTELPDYQMRCRILVASALTIDHQCPVHFHFNQFNQIKSQRAIHTKYHPQYKSDSEPLKLPTYIPNEWMFGMLLLFLYFAFLLLLCDCMCVCIFFYHTCFSPSILCWLVECAVCTLFVRCRQSQAIHLNDHWL